MSLSSLRLGVVVLLLHATLLMQPANVGAESDRIEQGRNLAHDFEKGNCLACHAAPSDPEAITRANIAPPLVAMRARFTDREVLRDQIWDAAERNPNTIMPPFGKHRILTEKEVDLITEFVYSL